MALQFQGGLFKNGPLQQGDGVLSDRWGQEGSTIKNYSVDMSADATVATVTTGRRLLINTIYINATTGGQIGLRDGGAGGTLKITCEPLNNTQHTITLTTPLYFDTDLYYDEISAGVTGVISLSGWEEDLQ